MGVPTFHPLSLASSQDLGIIYSGKPFHDEQVNTLPNATSKTFLGFLKYKDAIHQLVTFRSMHCFTKLY